ncbi:MAG TPA: TonB-dependent receptor [Vicinamibacterales bacterium]|nr:TonB-dependent receptor [Vicinamibacterales bacterium]
MRRAAAAFAPGSFLLALLVAGTAFAQATRETRILVTVVDQSNAVLPTATVTVTGLEDATRKAALAPVQAAQNGVATLTGLVPGRYSIQAEFPGFDSAILKDVRLRPGDNRQVIVLAIGKMQESVDVAQDAQAGAADRNGSAFGTALTRDQMDALSDDPDVMAQQLQDMAGPGSVLRIDSFEGGSLPPKAMIKAIHITRDQFAAENHSAEGFFIDVITQPGVGPIRANLNYNLHNNAMSARNAFTPTKGDDGNQFYGAGVSGGLIQNKASFNVYYRGARAFDTPNSSLALASGTQIQTLKLKVPRDNAYTWASFDYAVTRDQTLRMSYNQNDNTNRNLGIGGFNELERAYSTDNHSHTFRVQEAGPLGRRFFTNTRLNVGWTNTDSRSLVEAPTVRVIDWFTSGGAQVAGGRHSKDMNLGSDLDYVRGKHSLRAGTQIDANWYRSNDTSNYLGTYTFQNYDAYLAGTPQTYTRRIGDPNIRYFNAQAAFYLQDDIRVRKSLTITPGVRYEAQTHVKDRGNVGPRLGVTWAPFKNGKTTLRGSYGIFYDWLSTATYEQTLRVDGFRQRELQVLDPPYPDPSGSISSVTAVNRYLLDPALHNAKNSRLATGVDYAFTQRLRASATYRYVRGGRVLRGLNLNAPVNGIRPDPTFGNVIEVVSDGASRQHILQLNAQTPPPLPQPGRPPLWDWKHWGFFSSYTFAKSENNTDGPFSPPATGSLAAEWGPAPGSVRHRVQAGFTSSMFRYLAWQVDGQGSTGTPYTILTGYDDNGDSIFNDRPPGVGRNTARTAPQWALNLFMGYSFTFGPRVVLPGGPIFFGSPGTGISMATFTPPEQGRYRMGINLNIQNLTNHANLQGYSGVLSSPFYGRPTMAGSARRISVGMNLGF